MDAQAWLWDIPTSFRSWNGILGIGSLFCVLFLFYFTIMREKFSLLFVARVLYLIAFICFACRPLNSGWTEWGILFTILSGLVFSFLAATKWCTRQNPLREVTADVIHWTRHIFTRHAERSN